MAVLDGVGPTEVAAEVGVSRQSVHAWLVRYRAGGLVGLADRPSRPRSSPNQATPEVEARVCELRRAHPRWGALRIVHELMRAAAPPEPMPARATVHRISIYDSGERFVATVANDGPETCIRQIGAAEANDPTGQRYPRTKLSDDASLILWDVASGLLARPA